MSDNSWKNVSELWASLPSHVREPDPFLYLSDNYTVLDFETDTDDYGSSHNERNGLICACWRNGPAHPRPGNFSTVGSEFDMEELRRDIEASDYVVAHNAKFELGWLERCGLDLASLLPACTMLAEKVLAGNRPHPPWLPAGDLTSGAHGGFSLAACLGRRGWPGKDPVGALIKRGVDTRSIPKKWLVSYCAVDVDRTEALWLDQRETLKAKELVPVFFSRNILTPVLYDIERYGLYLDADRVNTIYDAYQGLLADLETEFAELSGGVNPKSPKQKIKLLYDDLGIPIPKDARGNEMLTDTGNPSTDAASLKALKLRTAKQKQIVELLQRITSVKDALSKYLKNLKHCADTKGVLYAQFLQHITQTHRLSSRGTDAKIQLQNFQRKFRPCIKPRYDGWFIGDGDAANLEFRVAVDLAKDEQGMQDIRDGVDIHANTASVLFDEWDPTIDPKEGKNADLRQAAKSRTFKPLYGGQSGTKRERDYFEWFKSHYHATATMQKNWTYCVLEHKWLRTASGLIFYWPDCTLSRDGKYIKYTTNIYDYPVQMFATADMSPISTVYLWHLMRVAGMQSFLINIVHDSAVGEIHPDETEQWSEYLKECYNRSIVWYLKEVYDYDWVTPLASEVKMAHHWSEPKSDWLESTLPKS